MTHSAIVPVEVNLQDYFFADAEQSAISDSAIFDSAALEPSPIAAETWQAWFERWLHELSADLPESQSYELSLRLTDDAEIQSFNAQYRQKDQPTDVLSFAALESDYPAIPNQSELPLYLGDIVISVETAQRQASQRGHTLRDELAWLAAHALLHLLGWDHPDEISLARMLHQQAFLLQTIGIYFNYDDNDRQFDQEETVMNP